MKILSITTFFLFFVFMMSAKLHADVEPATLWINELEGMGDVYIYNGAIDFKEDIELSLVGKGPDQIISEAPAAVMVGNAVTLANKAKTAKISVSLKKGGEVLQSFTATQPGGTFLYISNGDFQKDVSRDHDCGDVAYNRDSLKRFNNLSKANSLRRVRAQYERPNFSTGVEGLIASNQAFEMHVEKGMSTPFGLYSGEDKLDAVVTGTMFSWVPGRGMKILKDPKAGCSAVSTTNGSQDFIRFFNKEQEGVLTICDRETDNCVDVEPKGDIILIGEDPVEIDDKGHRYELRQNISWVDETFVTEEVNKDPSDHTLTTVTNTETRKRKVISYEWVLVDDDSTILRQV